MDINEMNRIAKERFKGACLVCRVCDGRACAGWMPGMGSIGTGSSFRANLEALADYKLDMRTLHSASDPDIRFDFLDHELSMPILAAAVAGVGLNMHDAISEAELAKGMIGGSAAVGSLGMTGDGPNPTLFQIGLTTTKDHGGRGIPIIKPRPRERILEHIRQAEEAEAWAVGVDVDAAGIIGMVQAGQPVGPKTAEEWEEIIASIELPLILKGIMTPDEAELALEIGAAGIVVSNHGGRVLDHTPGTADVLPEIAEVVKGDLLLLADGGVRSGADVLKMLALGADAVLVGRPLAIAAVGGGVEGVVTILSRYADELRSAMILTGCASLEEIDSSVLYV